MGKHGRLRLHFLFLSRKKVPYGSVVGKMANVTFRFLVWAAEPTVTTFATILRDGTQWSKAIRGERVLPVGSGSERKHREQCLIRVKN